MSHIFRIGDRVRGKWLTGPDAEVVIHSFQITPRGTIVKGEIMLIDGDCIVMQRNGRLAASHTDYLEPIQRSGNQISEILAMKDLPNRDCKIAAGEVCNG